MKASTKELELRDKVGQTVSYNHSPTLRAKLIKVNKRTCILEVAPTEFPIFSNVDKHIGKKFKAPLEYTWNAFFY